jgi:type I restriction enzyme S subunit
MIAAEIKYKKTGNEWVPEIPKHWQYLKLKFVSKLQGGYAFKSGDFDYDGIPVIRISDINEDFNEIECPKYPFKKEKIDDAFKVVNNDILIALTGATIGKTCIISDLKKFAYLNQRVAKVKNQDPFIYYCLSSKFIQDQIKLKCYGSAQENISNSDIENFYIPYPPVEERQLIIDKLNTQSAKITRFIQAKQRLIELLKEQRQSIITNAVTKGIDEGVKMKETGIDWMPEVPEHWKIRRFKNVCVLQRGHDLPKEQFKEGEFPVYGSNGIIGYHKEYTTKSPCITIGRSGSVGEINFVEKDFWAHNTCLFVKENYGNDWEYLFFLISSIDIKMVSNGSAVPTLDRNNVHSLRVSYPPTLKEQKQIVEHIKAETRTLDIAISKAKREIELIKEYREAMIAEAVTGKMKL